MAFRLPSTHLNKDCNIDKHDIDNNCDNTNNDGGVENNDGRNVDDLRDYNSASDNDAGRAVENGEWLSRHSLPPRSTNRARLARRYRISLIKGEAEEVNSARAKLWKAYQKAHNDKVALSELAGHRALHYRRYVIRKSDSIDNWFFQLKMTCAAIGSHLALAF